MANRFAKVIPGSTYIPHPYEEMFKVGLLKDQGIQNIIDKGQDFIDRSNYNTVFNPDTEYKISKVNSLVQSMNEAAKTNLNDPVNANKLRSVTNQFTNDHKVYDAIQRTNVFEQYQKNVKELGKDYRDQNALEYLDAIKRFNAGDQSAGEILKTAPSIDPYYDYNKEFHDNLKDIGDMGISVVNGDFIDNTTGKFATDGKGGIVSDDRIGAMFLNGLSSEAYQQMKKDYIFEEYNNPTGIDFESWIGNKAKTAQMSYSNAINKLDYTGRSLGYLRLKMDQAKTETPGTNPEYTPAQVYPSENTNWHLDADGTLHTEYGTFDERNQENIYTNSLFAVKNGSAGTALLQYIPLAKFITSLGFKLALGDTPDEKSMDDNEKRQYNDIRNIVIDKMTQDNPKATKFANKDIAKGMYNYMEQAKKMNNTNLLINHYTDPKDVKEQSELYFLPGEKGTITLQGNYSNRKFFGEGEVLSGSQWINSAGVKQPQVIGEFTPDNPYAAYGMPIQTSDGKIHFMEGDVNQMQSAQNNVAHNIYLAKYNNLSNANYFDFNGAKIASHYKPKTNSYQVTITENGKDFNYNIGGNSPDNVGTQEHPVYLTSPEVLFSHLAR